MDAPVPPVDLVTIRRRMNARRELPQGRRIRGRVAIALAAAIVAGLFLTARSPALVQSVRERYVAALHAAGIGPRIPKPVPAAIRSVAAPVRVSLAKAQQQAGFTVVPPTGVPRDVVSRTVFTSPLAVWSKQQNAWNSEGVQVTFAYVRDHGRIFDIVASRYSALSVPAARYVYDADDVPSDGKPNRRNRNEQFVWRNGDQTLRAVTSGAISAREIDRIRTAMRGVPLPRYDGPSRKPAGNRVERFVIPQ
ncbi:MAG: hypothetical protein M3154_02955 [Candidatus Eremiobacteraeota bacterium]|nr:hypothetical protein [Candidatus Eremiobacteraeota bacterium]